MRGKSSIAVQVLTFIDHGPRVNPVCASEACWMTDGLVMVLPELRELASLFTEQLISGKKRALDTLTS
jgi:hypothetical protein